MQGQNSKTSDNGEQWGGDGGVVAAARHVITGDGSPFRGFLDDSFVESATAIIDSFASGLTLTSLQQLLQFLVTVTHKVGKAIGSFKEKIWENKKLYNLVKEFLDNSDAALEFFTELEERLRRARGNQRKLETAILKFDKGIKDGNSDVDVLSSTLKELRRYVDDPKPFDEGFDRLAREIRDRYETTIKNFNAQIDELNKKMERSKEWRDVSCWMVGSYSAMIAAVFLFLAPPVSLVAGTIGLYGVMGAHYRHDLKREPREKEKKMLEYMNGANYITFEELKHIESRIRSLMSKLEDMLSAGEDALNNEEDIEVLKSRMKEIRNLSTMFNGGVGSLCEEVDKCRENIIAARKAVLEDKMMPSSQQM